MSGGLVRRWNYYYERKSPADYASDRTFRHVLIQVSAVGSFEIPRSWVPTEKGPQDVGNELGILISSPVELLYFRVP